MLRNVTKRLISDQERLQKLKASLPGDQYFFGQKKYVHPTMKVKSSLKERFEHMKEEYGEDYKTPEEKYDLHLPRVDTPEGGKSQEERYHEKTNYKDSKVLIRWTVGILFVVSLISIRGTMKEKRYEKENFEVQKQVAKASNKRSEEQLRILQERRAKIDQIKKEYKEKYGVSIDDDKSLSK